MKSFTVQMTEKQAARITTIARLMDTTPGDLLTAVTFGELASWDETAEPENFLLCARDVLERFVRSREVSGGDCEKLLIGAREKHGISLKELLELCEKSEREDFTFEPAHTKLDELMGKSPVEKRQAAAAWLKTDNASARAAATASLRDGVATA